MSDNCEIDSELSALRNELLTSLTKKSVKKSSNSECSKEANNSEDDYELEILRREALNAKRIKTETTIKKNYKPGRFRYDKESEEEEEDDYDEELNYKKSSIDYDDDNETNNLDNGYNPCNIITTTPNSNNNTISSKTSPEYCNYQSNYQTYRAEISKIMPNDEYDPDSIHDKQDCLPEGFDLRNFLREKALIHQQQAAQSREINEINTDENSFVKSTNDQDVVYEEPITEPINIRKELIYHKYKNKYDFNRHSTNRNYRSNHDTYDKYNKNRYSKTNENDDLNESESDDDDDSSNNCKKLRSVVAVISNSDNYQPSKDVQIVKSRSSSNNFYKRK